MKTVRMTAENIEKIERGIYHLTSKYVYWCKQSPLDGSLHFFRQHPLLFDRGLDVELEEVHLISK